MKNLIDAIIAFTVEHPIWAIVLCLLIGLLIGMLLIVAIVRAGEQENEEVYPFEVKSRKDIKIFFNKKNNQL